MIELRGCSHTNTKTKQQSLIYKELYSKMLQFLSDICNSLTQSNIINYSNNNRKNNNINSSNNNSNNSCPSVTDRGYWLRLPGGKIVLLHHTHRRTAYFLIFFLNQPLFKIILEMVCLLLLFIQNPHGALLIKNSFH